MAHIHRTIALLFIALAGTGIALATHNSQESLQARVAPVGGINFGEASGAAGAGDGAGAEPMDGPTVYATSCATCHDAGIAGAPVAGKADDWSDRLGTGLEAMVHNAINGFQGNTGVMPPKGGFMSLSDEEVTRAVEHMVSLVQPAGSAAEPEAAESEPAQAVAEPAPAADSGTQDSGYALNTEIAGKTYNTYCTICHQAGIAGAPIPGDRDNWEPRIAQGIEVLVDHAIKGYQGDAGVMPAKGGFTNLSDEEVAQAVYFMVEESD